MIRASVRLRSVDLLMCDELACLWACAKMICSFSTINNSSACLSFLVVLHYRSCAIIAQHLIRDTTMSHRGTPVKPCLAAELDDGVLLELHDERT
mmetsp:Transcript_41190/g.102471  ORF Transcript_41190/g.102471 Transcript_41190/m.102471 type:complete len:95 (-) Transcript_41190:253-537(-)